MEGNITFIQVLFLNTIWGYFILLCILLHHILRGNIVLFVIRLVFVWSLYHFTNEDLSDNPVSAINPTLYKVVKIGSNSVIAQRHDNQSPI